MVNLKKQIVKYENDDELFSITIERLVTTAADTANKLHNKDLIKKSIKISIRDYSDLDYDTFLNFIDFLNCVKEKTEEDINKEI